MRTPNIPLPSSLAFRPLNTPRPVVVSARGVTTANALLSARMRGASCRPDRERFNAAHRAEHLLDGGAGDGFAVCCIEALTSTEHEEANHVIARGGTNGRGVQDFRLLVADNTAPSNTTVVQPNTLRIYFTMGGSEMGDRRHAVDESVEQLQELRQGIEADFLTDDGVIDATERGMLIQFDQAVASIRRVRNLQRAVALAEKQDGEVTRYTRQQFAEAGLSIEPLDAA